MGYEPLLKYFHGQKIESRTGRVAMSILVISGTPWAFEPDLADMLEERANENKRCKKRTKEDVGH